MSETRPIYISAEAFEELVSSLTKPAKQTQSIIDGAALLRRLYESIRADLDRKR